MRVGVISDIHSNAVALTAVLNHLEQKDVETILCAGDVVGYYPMPNETIDILLQSKWNFQTILGNHDAAVIGETPSEFNIDAKRAIDWTRRELSREGRGYLNSLPLEYHQELNGLEIYMTHGSPDNPLNEYIWEENLNERAVQFWFNDRPPDFVIFGHTHRPYIRKVKSTTFVNPGSVGQPRDGNPRAAFAIVDLNAKHVNQYRVDYNIDEIAHLTKEYLPRNLADRLYKGK